MVTWSTLQNAGACSIPPPLLHRRPCLFQMSLNFLEQKMPYTMIFLRRPSNPLISCPPATRIQIQPHSSHTHNFYLYFLIQESDTLDNLTRILAVMSSPLKCDIVTTLPTSAFYFAIIHFDSWVQNKRGLRRKRLTS